ncbi:hypothetical protein PFISCL1PPCAC_3841, partial [Pristionchus fissidentatus]
TYDQIINDTMQAAIRAAFLAAGPSNYTAEIDALEQPAGWQTWVVGLAFITLCSVSAPIGMLILPCLAKWLYERIMSFLIALGIGALSGSCFFIMIPQASLPNQKGVRNEIAFGLTRTPGGLDYTQKSWIIVGSLYAFFFFDRILQYIFEIRRRRVKRRVHSSSLKRAMAPPSRQETVETTVTDEEGQTRRASSSDGDDSKRNELEIAVLNNIVARTFSTRRRVAVVKVDEIDLDSSDMRSAPPTPGGTRRMNKDTLRRVNSDIHHIGDITTAAAHMRVGSTVSDPYSSSNNNTAKEDGTLAVPGFRKKEDDEVSVSVQIVEKRIVDPKDLEIASIAYIIILGSSINNFLDGMSMGAAFADSLLRGVSIGISSFSQQFPQEVGTLAILANSGLGIKRTLLINLIPGALSYLGFVIGVLLDGVDESYDTYVFSVSAGMYLYVFLGTLIPEIRESTEELIKTNMKESLLVSLLQLLGMSSGVTFMYFMNKVTDVEIS